MTSLFPDVCTDDLAASRDFYRDLLGFEVVFENEWYVQMHHPRLPAIALTAFARSEDRTRALRAGFLVHVSKPVEPSELVASVASVSGRLEGLGR